ncbi:MAG: CapA family protein [Gordonia sp. (in: high G+C Gram-positive bacteria)]
MRIQTWFGGTAILLIALLVVTASSVTRSAAQPMPAAATAGPGEHVVTPSGDLTLSWVGDNILGTDAKFGGLTLPAAWEQSGKSPDYFFQNVRRYFDSDDLTIANFEVALTRSRTKRYKGDGEVYHFYGEPAVAKTLSANGIDVVTVANNHTFDFGQKGFDDTLAALRAAGVEYVGLGSEQEGSSYDFSLIRRVKGIGIGLHGYQTWADTPEIRTKIRSDIAALRSRGASVVIPYFHWGIESEHYPYDVQRSLARVAIDAGADAVIGTHPHVLQSLETYRGKLIAYSLGNFAFGGNTNPTDKRTVVLQTRLKVERGAVTGVDYRVVPTRLSRQEGYNDYVPTPYRGAEKAQVLAWLNQISPTMKGTVSAAFTPVP